MKKRIVSVLLGLCLTAGMLSLCVSGVSAETDSGKETEAVKEETDSAELDSEEQDPDEEISESAEEVSNEEKPEKEEQEETVTEEESSETVSEDLPVSESSTEEETETLSEPEGMVINLKNQLGENLTAVEIRPFSGESYSGNLLSEKLLLEEGEQCMIGIPEEFEDRDLGMYDVRITKENGEVEEIPFVPLLEDTTGTLYREYGTPLIRVRDQRLEAEAERISDSELRQREAEASKAMAEALSAEIDNQ
ncbi:MAG: hypothetical protein Q4B85_05105 [Lachnospiraceae bacterium]|nr:hypothetical protein [Lachnospiraceae bacterium]